MLSTQTQHTASGGMLEYPIKWITCHISSWRCIMRMFGQHRIGSMAFIIHNLLSWFIIYTYIIATFYSYIDCRFWPWPWFFLNWKNQYFTNLNYIRSHSTRLALTVVVERLHDTALYNACIVGSLVLSLKSQVYPCCNSIDLHQAHRTWSSRN